ncbi:MAG: hypothetical protein AB2603_20905 [Candidatus Thiodiazotropha endolucinida]
MSNGALNNFAMILHAAWALVVTMVRFLARLVGLLAEGTKVPDTNDATNHAVRGGVLNYRTGKLDDGTDPYGWYDRD